MITKNYMEEFIMRKLTLLMDQKNYMCIGNTHIFINFNHENFEYLTSINPRSVQKIHVFVTTHAAINNDLKWMIEKFRKVIIDGRECHAKIIIHLPYQVRELDLLLVKLLGFGTSKETGYKLITEKASQRFMMDSSPDCYHYIDNCLNIIYGKTSLQISITREDFRRKERTRCTNDVFPTIIKFPEYKYNAIGKESDPGIFETADMRLNPEMFKDKLIETFKKQCPNGILKSFKDDEDIWNYVMEQGMWKVKEDIDPSPFKNPAIGEPIFENSNISFKGPNNPKILITGMQSNKMSAVLSELANNNNGKIPDVIAVESLSGIGQVPSAELLKDAYENILPVPEDAYEKPRNRAERRAAKKGGLRK